jgi:hypothetical protein
LLEEGRGGAPGGERIKRGLFPFLILLPLLVFFSEKVRESLPQIPSKLLPPCDVGRSILPMDW